MSEPVEARETLPPEPVWERPRQYAPRRWWQGWTGEEYFAAGAVCGIAGLAVAVKLMWWASR